MNNYIINSPQEFKRDLLRFIRDNKTEGVNIIQIMLKFPRPPASVSIFKTLGKLKDENKIKIVPNKYNQNIHFPIN